MDKDIFFLSLPTFQIRFKYWQYHSDFWLDSYQRSNRQIEICTILKVIFAWGVECKLHPPSPPLCFPRNPRALSVEYMDTNDMVAGQQAIWHNKRHNTFRGQEGIIPLSLIESATSFTMLVCVCVCDATIIIRSIKGLKQMCPTPSKRHNFTPSLLAPVCSSVSTSIDRVTADYISLTCPIDTTLGYFYIFFFVSFKKFLKSISKWGAYGNWKKSPFAILHKQPPRPYTLQWSLYFW